MRTRRVRMGLLVLLLAAGAAAALTIWRADRDVRALDQRGADIGTRFERLQRAVGEIGSAQQAYVAPGQSEQASYERVSTLIQQLHDDTAAIRPMLQSSGSAEHLRRLEEATAALVQADVLARDNLRAGQEVMAADLVFGEARERLDDVSREIDQLVAAEATQLRTERAATLERTWAVTAMAALLWVAGLLLLVKMPAEARDAATQPAKQPRDHEGTAAAREIAQEPIDAAPAETAATATLDLPAAAAFCTAVAKLASSDELPSLLARAAAVLDAPGLVIWMGAGHELFAAAAHGYDPAVISRLGPISRHANNATAAAWRTGELRTVMGDMVSPGAVVAPMVSADGCIGVLAVEVRHGRESDAATRAVTTMFAAQLATTLAAWPAASLPQDDDSSGDTGAAYTSGALEDLRARA